MWFSCTLLIRRPIVAEKGSKPTAVSSTSWPAAAARASGSLPKATAHARWKMPWVTKHMPNQEQAGPSVVHRDILGEQGIKVQYSQMKSSPKVLMSLGLLPPHAQPGTQ